MLNFNSWTKIYTKLLVCLFRIHRDIRFRQDKSPYKTFAGIYIARGGKKSHYAGYYLHLEPTACMAGGGLYNPPTDIPKAARQEILYNHDKSKRDLGKPHKGIDSKCSFFITYYGLLTFNFEFCACLLRPTHQLSAGSVTSSLTSRITVTLIWPK